MSGSPLDAPSALLLASGFWGKLPAHGDFLHRGVSHRAREALDGWLCGCLAATSPGSFGPGAAWRFFAAAGVFGAHATAGVLAPSQDRVGRRFPLTIFAEFDASSPTHGPAQAWYAQLETQAQAAADLDAASLERALAEIAPPAFAEGGWDGLQGGSVWWRGEETKELFIACPTPTPEDFMRMTADWGASLACVEHRSAP